MYKRGQIFLIAVIILILATFSVVISYNTIKTYYGLDDFKRLSENYQEEYPKVYNYAVYTGVNVSEAVEDFSSQFLQQARETDPNFGVFYMYRDTSGFLHIVNTLNQRSIVISYDNPVTGEEIEFQLVDADAETVGEICIEGLGCQAASARVSDIDSGYYRTTIEELPEELMVEVSGQPGFIAIDLSDQFTSLTYTQSEDETRSGRILNVGVSLEES